MLYIVRVCNAVFFCSSIIGIFIKDLNFKALGIDILTPKTVNIFKLITPQCFRQILIRNIVVLFYHFNNWNPIYITSPLLPGFFFIDHTNCIIIRNPHSELDHIWRVKIVYQKVIYWVSKFIKFIFISIKIITRYIRRIYTSVIDEDSH